MGELIYIKKTTPSFCASVSNSSSSEFGEGSDLLVHDQVLLGLGVYREGMETSVVKGCWNKSTDFYGKHMSFPWDSLSKYKISRGIILKLSF